MGRQLRSQLSLLRPNVMARVQSKQDRQKLAYDQHAKRRSFSPDDSVLVRNFASGPKWLPGTITETQGPLIFIVRLQDGHTVRRHIDHIRAYFGESPTILPDDADDPLPNPIVSSTDSQPAPATALRRSLRNRRPPARLTFGPGFN